MQTREDRVDFSYAFAPPHRLTLCRPESGDKTLLDAEPGRLRMSWSYERLRDINANVWKAPRVEWTVDITPLLDGAPCQESSWERADDGTPRLLFRCAGKGVRCTLEAVGAACGALVRITLENTGADAHSCGVLCEHRGGWVISNPAWIDGNNPNALTAMQNGRPDRLLVFAAGADRYPVRYEPARPDGLTVPMFGSSTGQSAIKWEKSAVPLWNLEPGQVKTGWIVRPCEAYLADLPGLMARDWQTAFDAAVAEWLRLLRRAAPLAIPDPAVAKAFRACLCDVFVMREAMADGKTVGVPGTEVYRSPNSFEPCIASVLLDQLGLHAEAEAGLRALLESQEENGDWTDPHGWNHHMWGASGYKAWAATEHWRLTGDRVFLERVYPRMAACARWQEAQRAKTRVPADGARTAENGLMPRGMGDCGLMNGDDYFGVFYPHNFLSVLADRLALEAADALGKAEDLEELRAIYETARRDLQISLHAGSIREGDYSWIPGTPGKTGGSRWGALLGFSLCGLLPGDDPLVPGTLEHMERNISAGGLPVGTGWMKDGLWVAIALDNVALAHLALGNGDGASRYLYPVLNHASPFLTWCEERGTEPGTAATSGDLQHLWTPLAVCRYIRDALVLEREGGLELASGTPRSWLARGTVGVTDAPTHYGRVSYSITYDRKTGTIAGTAVFPENPALRRADLHIRLPEGIRPVSLQADRRADGSLSLAGGRLQWKEPRGAYHFTITASVDS